MFILLCHLCNIENVLVDDTDGWTGVDVADLTEHLIGIVNITGATWVCGFIADLSVWVRGVIIGLDIWVRETERIVDVGLNVWKARSLGRVR